MNDIIQCVKYDLNLKSDRVPMNKKNQRNSFSQIPSLCCMFSPTRHLLQLHHVHGRLQRGHHHPRSQLSSSTASHSRDAGMGNIFLISFHYRFDKVVVIIMIIFCKIKCLSPQQNMCFILQHWQFFFFNSRSAFCSYSGFPGLCA